MCKTFSQFWKTSKLTLFTPFIILIMKRRTQKNNHKYDESSEDDYDTQYTAQQHQQPTRVLGKRGRPKRPSSDE